MRLALALIGLALAGSTTAAAVIATSAMRIDKGGGSRDHCCDE